MLRKLNCFFNIVIGSFIGVFIGFGIYKFWHFKTYSNLYVMIYYNNLPGYGFMPGLTYLGEVLFSFGAVVLYCISFLISIYMQLYCNFK